MLKFFCNSSLVNNKLSIFCKAKTFIKVLPRLALSLIYCKRFKSIIILHLQT